jgi:hypothetical protein
MRFCFIPVGESEVGLVKRLGSDYFGLNGIVGFNRAFRLFE